LEELPLHVPAAGEGGGFAGIQDAAIRGGVGQVFEFLDEAEDPAQEPFLGLG
jgi:hypothetical protein